MDQGRQGESRSALVVAGVAVAVALGLVVVACTGDGSDPETVAGVIADGRTTNSRSSGQVDEGQSGPGDAADQDGPAATGSETDGSGSGRDVGSGDSPSNSTSVPGDQSGSGGQGSEVDPTIPAGGGSSFVPEDRPDGIEFVYVDGALGPVELGASIDDISAALGPDYAITPEEQIRVGFDSGYSVARGGEVLFWAIEEEDGTIGVLMSRSPKVGLDSGLRPKLPLEEAIALHGEPTITFGPEGREFVSFVDEVGGDESLSVLVAIGEFGGPVGVYEAGGPGLGEETSGFQPEDANISELWFWAA